ncbi:hypothetical protein AB0I68_21035 [Streptomyces sp. NPDC050448]|uniref:hypothetical protein n=1 Tax=Streptomyces sp. NPDC050448 TaxID=3155404 RepID=UPI003433C0EA
MTSFATHRRRVHDVSRPPYRRLSALRTCLTEFAPYGLRATYHHLCRSAGIPSDLERDPQALVRAVEELHGARQVWLAEFLPWQERRLAQKAAGVRVAVPPEPWRLLYCPDPESHPDLPLPAAAALIARAAGPWPPQVCPVCAEDRGTTRWRTGHSVERLCAGCGVGLGSRPTGREGAVLAARAERWKLIWRRRA